MDTRDHIQSLEHIDPQVRRRAVGVYLQLLGAPDIQAQDDGSISLKWKHWADETIHIDVKVYKV